jgi:hypothetical protein
VSTFALLRVHQRFTLGGIRVFIMLVLYETAMGFALFKLTDSAKLTDPNLHKEFETPERATGLCVQVFTTEALFMPYATYFPSSVQAKIEILTSIHVNCDCR